MAHDIFISYSHHDKPTADAIVAKFEAEGLRCWYAPRDIAPGEDWAASIIDAIKASKVFVVVFTAYSNGSQQVLREIDAAVSQGIPIIPFRLTNTAPSKGMQYYLSTVHWLDAIDGQLYENINVLGTRVRAVLKSDEETAGKQAEEVNPKLSTPKQKEHPNKKKWINLVIALIVVALVAVILWQTGVFSGSSTPEPTTAPTEASVEMPTDVPTPEPTDVPTPVLTDAPISEPTDVPTPVLTDVPTPEPTDVLTPEPTDAPIQKETKEPKQNEENTALSGTENDYPELRDMIAVKKKMIKKLIIAGDQVFVNFIYNDYNILPDADADFMTPYLFDQKNQERVYTNPGTLADLSLLEGMENLDTLWLIDQPIETLEGIEKFSNIYEIRICGCTNLEDVSPILELPDLRMLVLLDNHVRNLESVGKQKKLGDVYISERYVEDLSGLADWDVSFAEKEEGARLVLFCPLVRDYSFLRSIPSLSFLGFLLTDSSLWINELENTKINALYADDSIKTQEDFDKLTDCLIKNHPEITTLSIQFDVEIKDLTKLTGLPNLSMVIISEELWDAVTSLDGVDYQFELRYPE